MDLYKRHGGDHTTAGLGLLQNTRTGDPWMGQPKYTKGVVAVGCILILFAFLLSIPSRRRLYRNGRVRNSMDSEPPPTASSSGFARSLTSFCRFFAYRQFPSYRLAAIHFRLPVLGATLVMCVFMLGFTIWAFVVQPFYRVDRSFGSPPLALRSGMMALGLMPFVYVLGSKVNFISMVTGASHERLQVYHQWAARFMLFMATVHTLPFIHQPLNDGGVDALKDWFFSDSINTTGTIAYACLFVLVFGSMAGLRERCYELFIVVHIPVAIVFLAYMFIHCQQLLTSWRYLWGTAALYMLSVFLRLARQLSNNDFLFLSRCQVEALDQGLTRLSIRTPIRWKPGQHVFVRFPAIAPWSTHPFTIVSMPSDEHCASSTIVLLAKVHDGITKRLYQLASSNKIESSPILSSQKECCQDASEVEASLRRETATVYAMIDGPYGQDAGVADFDHVLFAAGGSGITFPLASLLDLAWLWQQGKANTRRAHLVWSVRQAESIEWVREHLETVEAIAPKGAFTVSIHVSQSDQAKQVESLDLPASWNISHGRHPDMGETIRAFINDGAGIADSATSSHSDLEKGCTTDSSSAGADSGPTSTAIVACGPAGMSKDVSNEAARIQLEILRGKRPLLSQLYLINEHFGW